MARTTRIAVLATALLSFLATVSATDQRLLDFPNCVESCIKVNGCKDFSNRCMCTQAANNMLVKVVACMRSSCSNKQIDPKSAYIDVMRAGCSQLKMPIPDEKIALAELAAGQGTVTLRPSPTTSKGAAPTESKTQDSQSTSATTTSEESSQEQPSSTAGPDTTPIPAPVPVPVPGTTTTTASPSQEAANTPRPDPREPTDSSPFATPIEAAVGRVEPPAWVWAAGAFAAIGGLR